MNKLILCILLVVCMGGCTKKVAPTDAVETEQVPAVTETK